MATIDRIFSSCDFSTRLHVRLRILTIPGAALNKYLPRQGTFLDLGGGHGALAWYLHLRHPGRVFRVLDFDEKKILNGRGASENSGKTGVTYLQKDIREISGGDLTEFSDILLADVLYLLSDKERTRLFHEVRIGLGNTHGTLWIKDVAGGQGWKSLWDKSQESAIQALGWTKTAGTSRAIPPEILLQDLRQAGFHADSFRLDQGYPHAHILYRAKPA